MKLKLSLLIVLGLLFSISSFAQEGQIPKMSKKNYIKTGDEQYDLSSWELASQYYEAAWVKQEDGYLAYRIAMCAWHGRDYVKAEEWFKTLLGLNAVGYPEAEYYYGLSLKANAKFTEAIKAFTEFKKTYVGEGKIQYKKWSDNQIKGCNFAMATLKSPDTVNVYHLGSNINNPYTDMSPTPFRDTMLIFASLRSDTIIVQDENRSNQSFVQFWGVPVINDSTWGEGKRLTGYPFNADKTNCGNGAFSPDYKRFYFTKCKMDEQQVFRCDIYMCEIKKDGKWGDAKLLGNEINDPAATNTQPSVTGSKSGEVLYFVSDRAGGEGGRDIWFSVRDKEGGFTPAINLGKKINTDKDEMSPYYDGKNKTLYFSSEGQIGMGGFDIFKSVGSQKKWADPKNMGSPINSCLDDMYYVLDDDKYTGYLVSNRPGIFHVKKSATCCDDIWRVVWPKIIYHAVRGYVMDSKTHEILDSADIKIVIKDTLFHNEMSAKDYMYFYDTKVGRSYSIKVTKDGYHDGSAKFSVKWTPENDTQRVDIYIEKIPIVPIVIKNVLYPYDKSYVTQDSYVHLDTLLMYLQQYPDIKVAIRSHTDSLGNDEYNQKLSQARAQFVVDWLVKKGIDTSRLRAVGMGESERVIFNQGTDNEIICWNRHADGKDWPEHRAINRRTDFKIIGVIKGATISYQMSDYDPDEDTINTLQQQKDQDLKDQQNDQTPQPDPNNPQPK